MPRELYDKRSTNTDERDASIIHPPFSVSRKQRSSGQTKGTMYIDPTFSCFYTHAIRDTPLSVCRWSLILAPSTIQIYGPYVRPVMPALD